MLAQLPEIQNLLQTLLHEVQAALGKHFTGLYIFGSLASGDFTPGRSDIDFLVVTETDLPAELLPEIAAMHLRLATSSLPYADKLQGSYIPRAALRRYDPQHATHPALRDDGSFGYDFHASDWIIQRWSIREHALLLAGPDPKTLIEPIEPADLRKASLGILQEWWAPMLTDPTRLQSGEYQAYAILTMCRILYTLQHGQVVSKAAAARWGAAALGDPWKVWIAEALAWRHGVKLDRYPETLALIRLTLDQSQQRNLIAKEKGNDDEIIEVAP